MSRDPKLRQYIPNSWKEAMQTCGGSGCQERSPLGTVMGSLLKSLGTQSHSMSHVSLPAGPHRVFSLPGSPRQASATEDPPHTPLSLSLPLHPRTPSLLSPCLECCPLWKPGSVPHTSLRLLRANPGSRCVSVTRCSFDQKSLNARLQESWAGTHPRHSW